MKRLFSIIGCSVLLAFIPLSSVWAVWEGNAGIAAATEFPGSGLYAKSDMFPKNTVVEIENLETEITVRAIITGTSGVPGLVAVLSPETAAALNIRTGSVSRVRISVPSVIEKSAPGAATESARTTALDPDVNPAAATASAVTNSASVSPSPEIAASSAPIAPVEQTAPIVAADSLETSQPTETAPVESPVIPLAAIAESPENPLVSLDDVPANVTTPEPAAAPVAASAVTEATEATAAEPAIASVNDQPKIFDTEPEIASAPVTVSDTVPPSSGDSEVTLVPSEPRPPEAPSTLDTAPIAETTTVAPIAAAPIAPAKVVAPVPVAPIQAAVIAPGSLNDLPLIQSLVKGSYYIQIATMSDVLNVRNIFNAYGKKYPIAIDKASNKNGDIMKVYIGPIQKDEYGAVLDRFQKLGFKDAFVKKGQ